MKIVDKGNEQGRVFSYMRWSSDPQSWGDSERRQQQQAMDWCQRHGRTLADQTFTDRGVSGWRGDNRKAGELGALLKTAQRGDTILVEDCDRWSREPVLDSMVAMRDLVNRGVEIVFLKNGVTLTEKNFYQDSVLISTFFAAHFANAENNKRASRIREAMQVRRALVEAGRPVRGAMPCWLKWDEQQDKPVVIEEKAKAVRRIFELSLNGLGVQSIIRELEGTPCISKSNRSRWNTRLVYRILTDKSVIGHYSHTTPTVAGVFPMVVSEADFYASCEKLKQRSSFTAPRKYENNNLFTGLCKCAACGSSLIKGRTGHCGKYYDYLRCSSGVRDHGPMPCAMRSTGIDYGRLEHSFLSLLASTTLMRKILDAKEPEGPSEVDVLRGKLAEVQSQAEKYLQLINDDPAPSRRLHDALKVAEAKEKELQAQLEVASAKALVKVPGVRCGKIRGGCFHYFFDL